MTRSHESRSRSPWSGPERAARVMRVAVALMSLGLVAMLVRVAQLQVSPPERLREHMQARVTKRPVPAARGDIVDRRYRYVATTEFGYRAVVDPTEFPSPPDDHILMLAQAVGADPAELGQRILSRVALNAARASARAAQAPAAEGPDVFDQLRGIKGEIKEGLREGGAVQAVTRAASAATDRGEAEEPEAGEVEGAGPSPEVSGPKPPIRYLVVSDVLTDEQVELVKSLKIDGVHLEQRGVRHYPAAEGVRSVVGKVGPEHLGLIGLERTFQPSLSGKDGRINYVRDAWGRPLWIGPDGFTPARRGEDVRLSIDLEVQRIAHEELTRRVEECDAAGGRCVVMDPSTGEILAMVDVLRPVPEALEFPWPDARPRGGRGSGMLYEPPPAIPRARYRVINPDKKRLDHPELARNRCVEDVYEPGSTFKSFVWAAATELGVFRPESTLDTGGGYWRTPYGRPIRDVHKHDSLTWREVLIESSNIGMSQAADRMSFDQLYRAVTRLGFGAPTDLGLDGETRGLVTSRKLWSKYTQTSVSFGQEVAVTPVQMVRAFSVFARDGEMAGTMPRVRLTAASSGDPSGLIVNRVLRPEIALLTRDALRPVAAKVDENIARAKMDPPPRYALFGKSGTAQIPLGKAPPGKMRPRGMGFYENQYFSSFIAGGPVEAPRLVVLVVIDDPGPELRKRRQHYGSTTAGPAVRRIMERTLAYLAVPPSDPANLMIAAKASESMAD